MKKIFFYLGLTALIWSCETDDVVGPPTTDGPKVTISLSQQAISENGGMAEVIASLSASATSDVIVTLALSGTAVNGTHYDITDTDISVPAGSVTSKVTITAIDDTAKDGNNTVIIDLDKVVGGNFDLQTLTLTIEDDDVPAALNIIFNEVLYDPSNSGLDGDANNDGAYSQAEDEFLEIVNLSSQPVDLTGFTVYDETALSNNVPRHTFQAGAIIPAGKALVLFGGGSPTGSFGGALVRTSTTGNLNMTNGGDVIRVFDLANNEVLNFDINPLSGNPNESYTRNPDLTGAFEQHSDNTSLLFSPGTKIDSSPF